jgi:hypothetical protein
MWILSVPILCRLLGEKNRLVRREQELTVESKQLELADLADRYCLWIPLGTVTAFP